MNLCDLQEIRALLARHGFHFSKTRGQNFLIQEQVPRQIVELAGIDSSCGVLEIGPGIGCLTEQLCAHAARVTAVEVDRNLEPILAETMAGQDNLAFIWDDIRKLSLPELVAEHFEGLRPMACANLPYYITTPVLTALLESGQFEAITVMVQKEVALRIQASAGTADYSAFSIFCQYHADPEILLEVPPECFYPRPKVTSAVIRLQVRTEPPCELSDEALFFRVVRASFAQRRKTLINGLSAVFGSQFSKADLQALLQDCGLPATVRGETLDIPSFAQISNALYRRMQV